MSPPCKPARSNRFNFVTARAAGAQVIQVSADAWRLEIPAGEACTAWRRSMTIPDCHAVAFPAAAARAQSRRALIQRQDIRKLGVRLVDTVRLVPGVGR